MIRHLSRLLAAVLVSTAAGVGLLAVPASAAEAGYVRLAHLSPDTPAVDVYLTSFRGSDYSKVLPSVSYGAVSPYQRVSEGTYTVSMRSPGDPESAPPLLTTNVTVKGGASYTVAGLGPQAKLALRVLTDDLTPPAAGKARVRVVQASAASPTVDVTTVEGSDIAKGAEFPSTTPYAEVDAQRWTIQVTPTTGDATPVEQSVDLASGGIYTLVVLDTEQGALALDVTSDAAGSAGVPVGAVAAGFGGAAIGSDGLSGTSALLAASLLAGAAILLVPVVRARRS